MLRAMQQEMQRKNQLDDARMQKDEMRDKAIQSLTTQMGQLASEVAALKQQQGKLPSDTQTNPKNAKNIPISGVNLVSKNKCYDECLSVSHVIAGLSDMNEEASGSDAAEPVVSIRVGKFKIHKALLDYGAGMSVLPGSLYDQYDFGPLLAVDRMTMFADASWKQPRGVVKDVMIQLGEFYHPVDFMVIDYAPSKTYEQPQVVLGHPFLHTANAQIDCRNGMVTISYGNRKLYFNVFLKSISYDLIDDLSCAVAANASVSCVSEGRFDEGDLAYCRSRVDRNRNQAKEVDVRRRVDERRLLDGGDEWSNEARFDPNWRGTANAPNNWMEMYGEKWGGKHSSKPP